MILRSSIDKKEFLKICLLFLCTLNLTSPIFGNKTFTEHDTTVVNNIIYKGYDLKASNLDSSKIYFDSAIILAKTINFEAGIFEVYYGLTDVYSLEGNYNKSDSLLNLCLKHYRRVNDEFAIGSVFLARGNNFLRQFVLDSAEYYFKKALKIRVDRNDIKGHGILLTSLGICADYKGDYAVAMNYYLKAIPLLEKRKNNQILANNYSNISTIYYNINEFEKALEYQSKALKMTQLLEKDYNEVMNHVVMAAILLEQKDYELSKKHADLAFEMSLKLDYKEGILYSQPILGDFYLETETYEKAITTYLNTLSDKDLPMFPIAESKIKMSIAETYMKTNKIKLGIRYIDDALAKMDSSFSSQDFMDGYLLKSKLSRLEGNYTLAYEYLEKSNLYRDSFFKEEKQKSTIASEIKFQAERKESENIILNQKNELNEATIKQQEGYIISSLLGFFSLIIISLLLWKRYTDKVAHNRRIQKLREEVDHRLRNQMNTALDIMEKFKGNLDNSLVTEAFNDFEQRLYALSALSQLLSIKNMDESIPMSFYLEQVTKNLNFNADSELHEKLKVTYDFCEVTLSSKDALNVALIVTELFTNSLKHAFDKSEEPKIEINLEEVHEDSLKLRYKDNGKGLAKMRKLHGEGMHLIDSMMRHLGGEGKINTNQSGFTYEALFPAKLT